MNLNLWGRLVYTLIAKRFRKKIEFMDTCITPFRVLPSDLDLNFHMNNARYFAWMDIGRLDLLSRSGMFSVMKRNNWFPVVADEKISFGKSLDLFDSVFLETKLHGWDAKNFYIQQQFKKKGEIYAGAMVKARILSKKKGPLETIEILDTLYDSNDQPNTYPWLTEWKSSRLSLLGRNKKNRA